MPCGSCVDKLARKLMEHHKIDMVRAYELAEKAVERVEKRKVETVSKQEMLMLGFDPDYSQPCTTPIFADCDMAGEPCYSSDECPNLGYCRETTCPAPLPNSHYVSKTCVATYRLGTCNKCRAELCGATGLCDVTESCYYDCDDGRVWNPVTLTCDLVAVALASKRLLVGVGL